MRSQTGVSGFECLWFELSLDGDVAPKVNEPKAAQRGRLNRAWAARAGPKKVVVLRIDGTGEVSASSRIIPTAFAFR